MRIRDMVDPEFSHSIAGSIQLGGILASFPLICVAFGRCRNCDFVWGKVKNRFGKETLNPLALALALAAMNFHFPSGGLAMAEEAGPVVSDTILYEFDWGELQGFIRAGGHHHGLIITQGAEGKPVTRKRACTLNLEHYSQAGKTAPFLPRDEKLHSHKKEGDTVTLTVAETPEWPLVSTIRYDLSQKDVISVTFTFEFHRDFPQFEGFVASYMADRTPPLIKAGGEWVRPMPETRYQMFIPRNDTFASWPLDGRWSWFPDTLHPIVSKLRYDIPVFVTRDDETQWALIQMVDPEGISALSPNTFAPAHDLCLVGRDVKAGEKVSVPVHLLYRQVERMEQVEEWYAEFLKSLGR
jgi:hypothetical protein